MEKDDDPRKLELEIERASRLAAGVVSDPTTYERLKGFVEELKQKLNRRLAARRARDAIKTRAQELWEQQGRPTGRDVEFWLQAESEIKANRN